MGRSGGGEGTKTVREVVVEDKKTHCGTRRTVGPEYRSDHRASSSSSLTTSDSGRSTVEDAIFREYISRLLLDGILKIWERSEPGNVLKSRSVFKM